MNRKIALILVLAAAVLGVFLALFPGRYLLAGAGVAALLLGVAAAIRPQLAMFGAVLAIPLVTNELALAIALLSVGAWGLTLFYQKDARPAVTDLDLPIALLVILLLVSTVISVNPASSLPELVTHFLAIGLFVAMVNVVKDRTALYRVVLAILAATTLVSLAGIYHYVTKAPPPESGWVDLSQNPYLQARAYSTFGNPNLLAMYLLFTAPLALALAMACRSYFKKAMFGSILVTAGLCMLLTFSRGGWAGLFVAIAGFGLLIDRRLCVVLVLVTVFAVIVLPKVDVVERRLASAGGGDTSVQYRLTVWNEALLMIRDYWPIGVGLGHRAYMQVYPAYMLDRHKRPYHSHNQYLQLVIESGILGLLLYGWIALRVFRRTLDLIKHGQDRLPVAVSAAVTAALLGILVMGLTDNILYRPKLILTFWMVLGLGQAASLISSRRTGVEWPRCN